MYLCAALTHLLAPEKVALAALVWNKVVMLFCLYQPGVHACCGLQAPLLRVVHLLFSGPCLHCIRILLTLLPTNQPRRTHLPP